MIYTLLTCAIITLAAWDAHRRWLADRRTAREFERTTTSELAEKLTALTARLERDLSTQSAALTEFLKQMRELVKFSEERRKDLERTNAGRKLP